jgi:hypothetical protein
VIDGAGLLQFVGDQLVALVEEQYAELLAMPKLLFGFKRIEGIRGLRL